MLDALTLAKTPTLLTAVYKECLWKIPTREKKLYLTFDDGPIAEVTPFVLDELKKYEAKATFFCIGKNAEANPDIFQRVIREGHSIGNHTYDHISGWKSNNKTYYNNIEKCELTLNSNYKTQTPGLFRPPYGKLKLSQYRFLKQKYCIAMWDVLAFDFVPGLSGKRVLKNVVDNAEPGSIVVFHDSMKAKERVEFALPKVLEHFSSKGFKFEKL